jgi:hypothetical protein
LILCFPFVAYGIPFYLFFFSLGWYVYYFQSEKATTITKDGTGVDVTPLYNVCRFLLYVAWLLVEKKMFDFFFVLCFVSERCTLSVVTTG